MSLKILLIIYLPVLAIELFANLNGRAAPVQFVSKPLLMLILLAYFVSNSRKMALLLKYPIIFALAFSWLGDVLLLIDKHTKTFFVYGLTAFLVAHLCYIFYFLKIRRLNNPGKAPNALLFLPIAGYSLSLLGVIAPNVKHMILPVAIYALVISVMLAASFSAFDLGKQNFGKISVAGTLLFIVSDSILAINRFAAPFELAPVFVMTTYALAQLLITEGSLRNLKEIEHG